MENSFGANLGIAIIHQANLTNVTFKVCNHQVHSRSANALVMGVILFFHASCTRR